MNGDPKKLHFVNLNNAKTFLVHGEHYLLSFKDKKTWANFTHPITKQKLSLEWMYPEAPLMVGEELVLVPKGQTAQEAQVALGQLCPICFLGLTKRNVFCARCGVQHYCSKECKRAHQKSHLSECRKICQDSQCQKRIERIPLL